MHAIFILIFIDDCIDLKPLSANSTTRHLSILSLSIAVSYSLDPHENTAAEKLLPSPDFKMTSLGRSVLFGGYLRGTESPRTCIGARLPV